MINVYKDGLIWQGLVLLFRIAAEPLYTKCDDIWLVYIFSKASAASYCILSVSTSMCNRARSFDNILCWKELSRILPVHSVFIPKLPERFIILRLVMQMQYWWGHSNGRLYKTNINKWWLWIIQVQTCRSKSYKWRRNLEPDLDELIWINPEPNITKGKNTKRTNKSTQPKHDLGTIPESRVVVDFFRFVLWVCVGCPFEGMWEWISPTLFELINSLHVLCSPKFPSSDSQMRLELPADESCQNTFNATFAVLSRTWIVLWVTPAMSLQIEEHVHAFSLQGLPRTSHIVTRAAWHWNSSQSCSCRERVEMCHSLSLILY